MARIELEFPGEALFTTTLPVNITDINYGKHLGNDKVLGFMHEARVRFFEWLGYTESDIDGVSVIQADTAIVYRSEAFYKDQLQVEITTGDFTRAGFDLWYKIYNLTQQKVTAVAKTGMVCFDYNDRKVKSVPPAFVQKCEAIKPKQL